MEEKEMTAEQTLAKIESEMKKNAMWAAMNLNQQAEDGDVERNHVNYGEMIHALSVLRMMGHEETDATWEKDGLLICEFVQIDGVKIYERYKK